MTWLLRRATRDDAAGLARVQVASWRSTYRGIVPEAFLAQMEPSALEQRWVSRWADVARHIFVIEGDSGDEIDSGNETTGSVCGFACGGSIRLPIEQYDAELYAIYLVQDRQRQGAGRELLRAVAQSLHAAGFKSMLAWVLEANPSLGFYERMGARLVASKTIDIGGVDLPEVALAWQTLPFDGHP